MSNIPETWTQIRISTEKDLRDIAKAANNYYRKQPLLTRNSIEAKALVVALRKLDYLA